MGFMSEHDIWLKELDYVVECILRDAVVRFYKKDASGLLVEKSGMSVGEMAIIGCIYRNMANSVEALTASDRHWRYEGLSVDVEYNLMTDDDVIKSKNFYCKHCESCKQFKCAAKRNPLCADSSGNRHFRPDIIIHRRRTNSFNVLMVEVKVGKDRYIVDEGNALKLRDNVAMNRDLAKLCCARCREGDFKYSNCISLIVDTVAAYVINVSPFGFRASKYIVVQDRWQDDVQVYEEIMDNI